MEDRQLQPVTRLMQRLVENPDILEKLTIAVVIEFMKELDDDHDPNKIRAVTLDTTIIPCDVEDCFRLLTSKEAMKDSMLGCITVVKVQDCTMDNLLDHPSYMKHWHDTRQKLDHLGFLEVPIFLFTTSFNGVVGLISSAMPIWPQIMSRARNLVEAHRLDHDWGRSQNPMLQ